MAIKDGSLPAGRPVRVVAAPSQNSRHQRRPHTSPAHHAQQLWPGMEHDHATPPSQRAEELLRQAQAAEGAQLRPQQRRACQPGGTWVHADAACKYGALVTELAKLWAEQWVLGLHEEALGPQSHLLLPEAGSKLSARVHDGDGYWHRWCRVRLCPDRPPTNFPALRLSLSAPLQWYLGSGWTCTGSSWQRLSPSSVPRRLPEPRGCSSSSACASRLSCSLQARTWSQPQTGTPTSPGSIRRSPLLQVQGMAASLQASGTHWPTVQQ